MKKRLYFLLAIFLGLSQALVWAGEKAPQKVMDLAQNQLAAYGQDPVIVRAVKDQNAKGETLDQIKARDKEWQGTAGLDDFMKSLMTSECGRHIEKILNDTPFLAEIFVMDQNGANVAMTDKTSDYWQGDEAKFENSFKGGAGAVFVDEVSFDDSAQAYLVQVSVPVMEGNKAIGAITFGIDLEKLEQP